LGLARHSTSCAEREETAHDIGWLLLGQCVY